MSRTAIIHSFDRLGLTLFLAACLHVALILGVGFDAARPKPRAAARTLEVMVVHNARKPDAPEEADFLAQTRQKGGGQQEKAVKPTLRPAPVRPTARPPAPAPTTPPATVTQPGPKPRPEASRPASRPTRKLTAKKAPKKIASAPPSPPVKERKTATQRKQISLAQLLASSNQEIQRISAELDRKTRIYAKRPRRKAINASTREYKYATYLDAWRRKVERVGNLNYPDEAKRKKLYGNLVLHVAVRADGSIDSIRILHSSGHKLLDDAAIRIVNLAAPFAPFPPDIRKETDILDITRTWRFLSSNRLGWKK